MSNIDFAETTINDPVHGSIKLSKTELSVIDTATFQRLRGLKQLGLADLVFPGATHSRFAHSIGVLHIVSEMLEALERNYSKRTKESGPFTAFEKQKIRLAALLHDVGHLPLSHAMEQPIQRLKREQDEPPLKRKNSDSDEKAKSFGPLDDTASAPRNKEFKHETFGKEILLLRKDISDAIKEYNEENEIGNIITKSHFDNYKYSQFITGDLDADRIDFLLRDSLAAGVSYGNVDLKYLLDNIEFDKETQQFFIANSGIHALEHFITSRFFLYNVTYHKTVMGLELLAKYAFYKMVKDESVEIISSEEEIYNLCNDTDKFLRFDDNYFWERVWKWNPSNPLDISVKKALLLRNPARELYSERIILEIGKAGSVSPFKVLNSRLYSDTNFEKFLKKHHIDRERLAMLRNVINFVETPPMKNRSEQPDIKKEWALCKVMYDGEITPLIDVPGSILSNLSSTNLNINRLYYLPQDPLQIQSLNRDVIRRDLKALAAEN